RPHHRSPPFPYTTLFRSQPCDLRFAQLLRQKTARVFVGDAKLVALTAAIAQLQGFRLMASGAPQGHEATFEGVEVENGDGDRRRSEEHTSELQSRFDLVC